MPVILCGEYQICQVPAERARRIRPVVGLHSSRLTLESNYNDRRRNPRLGRGSFLERRAGLGGGAAEVRLRTTCPRPTNDFQRSKRTTSRSHVPSRPPTPPRTVITQFVRTPLFQGRPSVFMAAATAALIPRPCLFQFLFV